MNSGSAVISLGIHLIGFQNQTSLHQVSAHQHNRWMGLGIRVISFQLIGTPQYFTIHGDGFAALWLNAEKFS